MITREELTTIATEAASNLHNDQRVEAARVVLEALKLDSEIETDEQANAALKAFLAWVLNADRYDLASKLLWTPTLFTPDPQCTKLVWQAFEEECAIMLMGAASMSKSYSGGVWLMLDWLRDPLYTNVKVIGPSEQHLRDNLFTHLVTMHNQASIPLPGEILDLFIGLDPRARKSAITGVVIPIGKKAAGRIQGAKRVARPKAHPQFGPLTRMRIFIDEIENVQSSLWGDIDNVVANVEGKHGLKIAGAFNPRDITSEVSTRCAPPGGWEKGFDPERSETWMSQRGWRTVRLDALKCENVIQKKVIYPGLQTVEGIERIILNSGGTDTPGYATFVRAMYPRAGAVLKAIPSHFLTNLKAEIIFVAPPVPYAGVDVALSGGDAPKMAVGKFGAAASIRFSPSLLSPNGLEIFFKNSRNEPKPRMLAVLEQVFTLEPNKEDKPTVALAKCIKEQGVALGIDPGCVMLDRTGNGAGVHDVLQTIWSPSVNGVNSMQSASESKIMEEDTESPEEAYGRVYSELWFALRKWIEFGFFYISPLLDTGRLFKQLGDRNYSLGKFTQVEDKPTYKARNSGESPDDADAVTLFLMAIRRHTTFIPSAVTHGQFSAFGQISSGEMPCRVDCTNAIDDDI